MDLLEPARTLGYWVCHQDPVRSMDLGGEVLPICARCTPLYVYLGLALWAGLLAGRPRARAWPVLPASAAALGCVVILVQWGGAQAGLWQSTAIARTLTGMAAGAGLGWLIHCAAASRFAADRPRSAWLPAAAFLAPAAAVAALLFLRPSWPVAAGIVGWASILGFLSASAWIAATILSYVIVDPSRRPRSRPILLVVAAGMACEILFLAMVRV